MSIKGILGLLLVFVLGMGAGIGVGMVLKTSGGATQNSAQVMPPIIKSLSSKVVPSVTAYGTVTAISGSSLTVTSGTDSMVIPVATTAKIYAFTLAAVAAKPATTTSKAVPATTASSTKTITFAQVKVGDKVSVNLKVLPSGYVQGLSVIVLPPAPVLPKDTTVPK